MMIFGTLSRGISSGNGTGFPPTSTATASGVLHLSQQSFQMSLGFALRRQEF